MKLADEQIFDATRKEGVICSAGLLRVVRALLSASKPAAPQDERIDQLERALVYVAHTMHGEPQYRLAEGITLGDVSYVRVQVGDVDVQVNIPEASARTLYAAARDTTERKVAKHRAASQQPVEQTRATAVVLDERAAKPGLEDYLNETARMERVMEALDKVTHKPDTENNHD